MPSSHKCKNLTGAILRRLNIAILRDKKETDALQKVKILTNPILDWLAQTLHAILRSVNTGF